MYSAACHCTIAGSLVICVCVCVCVFLTLVLSSSKLSYCPYKVCIAMTALACVCFDKPIHQDTAAFGKLPQHSINIR